MDLSIIIVNYKSKRKLINCLDSISRSDLAGLAHEIIVVENASGDDLSDLVSKNANLVSTDIKLKTDIKLIESPRNLGMGGGNNLGIKAASGEFILILNPDTVLREDAILILINYLRTHSEAGLMGPKLLYPDGSLQLSCLKFPTFFIPVLRRTFLGEYFKKTRDDFTMSDFNHASIKEVDWMMGSCLMFRKKMIAKDGSDFFPRFDERYFMYFEDTDLAREIKSRGYQAIYHPEAVVVHDHARESAKNPWYIAIFKDKLTWTHIASWFKYFIKWGLNPRVKK